ncbi:carboxypeptidase regulatory-like domain-containing protein [bacterium]|nr:carboxypeptidase regulatory-like domain-containing protein [bacterium]
MKFYNATKLIVLMTLLLILGNNPLAARESRSGLQRVTTNLQAEDTNYDTPESSPRLDGELDRSGGPDDFGYLFFDDDEEEGPVYNWIDISETGEEIGGIGNDETLGPFEIGFDFGFYGTVHTEFWVCSNGWIAFDDNNGAAFLNQQIPSNPVPNNMIAACWDDFNPEENGGTLYYGDDGNGNLVIQFEDFGHAAAPGGGRATFEAILHPNGDVVLQYQSVTLNDRLIDAPSATIGIENPDGTDGLQYVYNSQEAIAPYAGLAVLFTTGAENALVEGFINDECTGDPIAGAQVWFDNEVVLSEEDGYYSIEALVPHEYTVRVVAEEYPELFHEDIEIIEGDNVYDFGIRGFPEFSIQPEELTFEVAWQGTGEDQLSLTNTSVCAADFEYEIEITFLDDDELDEDGLIAINFAQGGNVQDLENPQLEATLEEWGYDWMYINSVQEAIDAEADVIFGRFGGINLNQDELTEYIESGHGYVQNGDGIDWFPTATHGFFNGANIPIQLNPEINHPILTDLPDTWQTPGYWHYGFADEYMAWVTDVNFTSLASGSDSNGRNHSRVLTGDPLGNGYTAFLGFLIYGEDAPDASLQAFRNALIYVRTGDVGGNWLSVTPDSNIIPAGENRTHDVFVNANEIDAPGVYQATIDIIYNNGGEEPAIESVPITMTVTNPGSLEGIVFDASTDTPVEGAVLTVWDEDEEPYTTTQTDENGAYSLPLGAGMWDVMASADGFYDSDIWGVEITDGEITTLDIGLETEDAPELVADPETFDFEVGWLGEDNATLTLSNIGGLDADWFAQFVYPEEELTTLQEGVVRYFENRNLDAGGPYNHLPNTLSEHAFPIVETSTKFSELDDPFFLIVQDFDPFGSPAIQNTLDEMNVLWDMITADQLEGYDLEEYSTVIFPSVQSQDFLNTVMDNAEQLELYMLGGGWVIFGGCTHNWNWELWGVSNVFVPAEVGVNSMPNHPIMEEIPEEFSGLSNHHDFMQNVPENANILARNLNNQPILIETSVGSGNLIINTMASEAGWLINPRWENANILINMLAYSVLNAEASQWISLQPTYGTLEINTADEIGVAVDAYAVELPGVYDAMIEFNVHEPDTLAPTTVWVTMEVGDPGTLEGQVADGFQNIIQGAEITIWEQDAEEPLVVVTTDDNGYYIYPLGAGQWDVEANAQGYYPSGIQTVEVTIGETTILDFELEEEVEPFLILDPENFEFVVEWGDTDTDVLTLGNSGGLPADWYTEIIYIEDEELTTATGNHKARFIQSTVDEWISRSGVLNQTLPSQHSKIANVQIAPLTQPGQIARTVYPDQRNGRDGRGELDTPPDILLYAAAPDEFVTDVMNKLESTDQFNSITFLNAAQIVPEINEVIHYDAIFTFSDPTYADAEAAGDLLAEYLDRGKPVVCALFTIASVPLGGEFAENNYWCIEPSDQIQGTQETLGEVFMPEHPIMEDVHEFEGGELSFHQFTTETHPDAERIADWTDGRALIATRTLRSGARRVDLGFYPPSGDAWEGFWNPASDGTTIMANALLWATSLNSGWLVMTPRTGYLEVDDIVDIDLTIDTTIDSLPAGVYEALILFNFEYPEGFDPATAWITLVVENGAPQNQFIELQPNYFELISTYLNPERFDINAIDLFGDLPGLNIVYQNDGNVFIPPNINTIGNIDYHQAYRVFSTQANAVLVQGDPIESNVDDYSFNSGLWQWMGYPFDHEVPVETALSAIADEIIIIINDDGHFWIPDEINTLGNLRPGEGYMVFLNDDVIFNFVDDINLLNQGTATEVTKMPSVEGAPKPTGLPWIVLVNLSEELRSQHPSFIELYDGNLLVGKSLVSNEHNVCPVVAWQGSAEPSLPGFTSGNSMTLVVYNASGNKIPLQAESLPVFGDGAYATVALGSVQLPREFTVAKGYPNPFNPSVTIPFALSENGQVKFAIYNLLGQRVHTANEQYEAGFHRFILDTQLVNEELVSGVYFIEVNFRGDVRTQKVVLLR